MKKPTNHLEKTLVDRTRDYNLALCHQKDKINNNGKSRQWVSPINSLFLHMKLFNIRLLYHQSKSNSANSRGIQTLTVNTFLLIYIAEGLINSTTLLKNSMWQIYSGGFLFIWGIQKDNLDLIVLSTARYPFIHLKRDSKCFISSLNIVIMSFINWLLKEAMFARKNSVVSL